MCTSLCGRRNSKIIQKYYNPLNEERIQQRIKDWYERTKETEIAKNKEYRGNQKKKQTSIIKHIKSLAQEKQNFNKARKNSVKGTNLTSSKQNSN